MEKDWSKFALKLYSDLRFRLQLSNKVGIYTVYLKIALQASRAFFRDLHLKVTVSFINNRLGLVDLIFALFS